MSNDVTREVLKKVVDFKTLPTIYTSLIEVMANPRSTTKDASDLISKDQAAATKILRAANSPIYGYSGTIDTISRAVFCLGFNEVRNLIAALSIMDLFKPLKANMLFNPVAFWKHSIAVGVICRAIGRHAETGKIENYFLSGILHDIGKLVFFEHFRNLFNEALNIAAVRRVPLNDVEKDLFGISHSSVGALLAERWKIPVPIRETVAYHEAGVKPSGDTTTVISAVHIANITAKMLDLGMPGDARVPMPNKACWTALNLPNDFFDANYDSIVFEYEDSVSRMLSE